MGRLPGSLLRDNFGRFATTLCDDTGNVTTLLVQPSVSGAHALDFDSATLAALAGHIANEMAQCCESVRSPDGPDRDIAEKRVAM